MERNGAMIELNEVSKRIGAFELRQCNIKIPGGYICGIAGPNGAGKTTLLHLLLGLYRPDSGTVQIDGRGYDMEEKQIHDRIGTVLVDELFNPALSVWENGRCYGKYFSRYDAAVFRHYLVQFGVDGKKRFEKLSKGEKLKAQFAFALSHTPELLILDEPASNFDPEFREQFFRILQEFISDGRKSVILTTHLTEDLDCYADYLLYLSQGEIVYAGDIEQFREAYRVVSGERYRITGCGKKRIVALEENAYCAKALMRHRAEDSYDEALTVSYPTVQEFMYFYEKRGMGL